MNKNMPYIPKPGLTTVRLNLAIVRKIGSLLKRLIKVSKIILESSGFDRKYEIGNRTASADDLMGFQSLLKAILKTEAS